MMIFAVAEEGRKGEQMVDKELIEIWRNELKPAISLLLLNINYEEMGEQDKEEFERDFDEILDLALIGLKYKTQLSQESTTDTISRQAANTKMKKYRKKPIVIDAYQTDVTLDIETLEGIMRANVGDYIIIGVNGEQYPCKPDIFKKTYEEISDE